MATYLDVLARAISDVGYWRWWVARFPEFIQLEFGGTQLWNPPQKEGKPPSGLNALRFDDPVSVSFVTHRDAPADFPKDWPELLHNDAIEPPPVHYDRFAFNDRQLIGEILSEAAQVDTRFGADLGTEEFAAAEVSLAFQAGPTGLIVAARGLTLLNFQGGIRPEEIEQKYDQWWGYWKEYWRLKGTDKALARDYACEVTIPAGEEEE